MPKKKRLLYEGDLPVYEIVVNDDDTTGIRFLSIVENPAIEITGMAFSETKMFEFSVNKDEQIIAGPALVPNKKIYRDDDGMEYYVVFTTETIKKIVQKFVKENNNRAINVDHSNTMVKAYIQEHWMIADTVYDKSKAYGFNLPVGTWFVCVKIEDENFWKTEVKELNKVGFSIEGILGQKLMYMSEQVMIDEVIDTLTESEIEYIFAGEYRYRLQPFDPKSKWHTHPNCNCTFSEGVWTFEPTPDGKYPCDICIDMSKKYKKWYTPSKENGGPASTGFSMNFEKISFDYHKTLNTPEGKKLAEKLIKEGNDIHIVTNASKEQSDRIIKEKAKELNIPISNIHYADGDKVGMLKKLGIKKHYDNNSKEISDINEAGLKGIKFQSLEQQFESHSDYPDGVKNNAKKVLDWTEKNGWGSCGTPVGKTRANQLANGESISVETIKRMYSYLSRHEGDLDTSTSFGDGCGYLMYMAWGGKAALGWSRNKLRELGELDENGNFTNQEFVGPSKNEKEDEFIGRCITYIMNKGETDDNAQAYAICKTKWDNK